MVASIGKIASSAQGVRYFERDGYYARDDKSLGRSGLVDPDAFGRVLEGEVPGGQWHSDMRVAVTAVVPVPASPCHEWTVRCAGVSVRASLDQRPLIRMLSSGF